MNRGSVCARCWRTWRATHHFQGLARRKLHTTPLPDARLQTAEDWMEMQLDRESAQIWRSYYSQFGSTQNNTWKPHYSLHAPSSPGQITLSALLAAGAHLGHSSSLMNPNFIPYAYGTRAGLTVIDLDHTLAMLRRAANLTRAIAAAGGSIIFLGTRPDIRGTVKLAAERIGDRGYYVSEKWLPGTLTNRIHHHGLDAVESTKIIPDLVVILNPLANMPAIRECAIEHVPTIGIIDSNVDPRVVMYAIPANDESTRTAEIIAGVLSIAGREGVEIRKTREAEDAADPDSVSTEYKDGQTVIDGNEEQLREFLGNDGLPDVKELERQALSGELALKFNK